MIKIFKDIREKNNGKTIIISHQERIINIADKIILLDSGKIKEIKTKEELNEVIKLTPCCKVGGNLNE